MWILEETGGLLEKHVRNITNKWNPLNYVYRDRLFNLAISAWHRRNQHAGRGESASLHFRRRYRRF